MTEPRAHPDERAHERHTWPVLAGAAALGFAVAALTNPTWTDNVESAQVLANLVAYPADNVMRAYHTTVYTILIQAAAVLLRAGVSEWTLSLVFSGLQGAVACSALALFTLAVSRSVVTALAVPMLLLWMASSSVAWPSGEESTAQLYAATFHGHLYPNTFPNGPAIYGTLGLHWMLLVLGLAGLGKVRASSVALGLLPAIHAGLALACCVGLLGCAVAFPRSLRRWAPSVLRWGAIGLAVSALTLAWQVASHWEPSPGVFAADVQRVATVFADGWDDHNPPLLPGEWRWFFESEYYTGALAVALLFFARRRLTSPARVAVVALLAITAAAIAYTVLLDRFRVPWMVHVLMATRWLNLSSLAFVAMGVGLLGQLAFRDRDAAAGVAFAGLLALVLSGCAVSITRAASVARAGTDPARSLAFPVAAVLVPLGLAALRATPWHATLSPRAARVLAAGAGVALVGSLAAHSVARVDAARIRGRDAFSDILAATGARGGLLLVGDGPAIWEAGRIQLRTRRPLLLDPTQLNLIFKVPSQGPLMESILLRAYDVLDMREGRPPLLDEHWRAYLPRRWQSIRADFGVTDVLVRSEIPLPLPLVAAGGHLALYTIPRLAADPAAGAAPGAQVAASAASRATISSRDGPSAAFGR